MVHAGPTVKHWILRYSVALGFVGVVAASLSLLAADDITSALDRPASDPTTTTTDQPSPFPRLAAGGPARAVRTGSGLVLPVTGGGPGNWQVRTPCAATAAVDGEPLSGAHVVLDPGHGGTEIGAVGPSGLTEAELNLDIAVRAARRLQAEGATVVLTRSSDVRITLQTRAEIASGLNPLAFISIHHNAAPRGTSDVPGSEIYHQLASAESRRLAGLLWEELIEELDPFSEQWAVGGQPGALARQSAATGDDYYGVLRGSQGVPAVLSEAAYLSNPAEDALLNTEAFRDAEAKAITEAVMRYVTTDEPGSGFRAPKVIDVPAGGGGGAAGCEDPPLS